MAISIRTLAKAVIALTPLADVAHLKAGHKVRLAFASDGKATTPRLLARVIYQDSAHLATVARADNDNFIRADEPTTPVNSVVATAPPAPTPDHRRRCRASMTRSMPPPSQQQMPKPLVDQLIRILAFDVDLQAHIGPGDAMEVFHSLPDAPTTRPTPRSCSRR